MAGIAAELFGHGVVGFHQDIGYQLITGIAMMNARTLQAVSTKANYSPSAFATIAIWGSVWLEVG
jgi:hypothetical protein